MATQIGLQSSSARYEPIKSWQVADLEVREIDLNSFFWIEVGFMVQWPVEEGWSQNL